MDKRYIPTSIILFTTHKYIDFYKRKFGFKFLTIEFKKNWENSIIKELLKI